MTANKEKKAVFDYTDSVLDAQNGSEEAFQFIYEQSQGYFRTIISRSDHNNTKNMEDILQMTYLKIFENLKSLRDPSRFLPWARQICLHEIANFYRELGDSDKNEIPVEQETVIKESETQTYERSKYDIDINPDANLDAKSTAEILHETLDMLSPMQRNCLLLWAEDIPEKEIAKRLGSSYGSVRTQIHLAMKKMKPKLVEAEKKLGVAIFGVEPVPFFLWLLRNYEQKCTVSVPKEVSKATYKQITQGIHAFSSGAITATADAVSTASNAKSAINASEVTGNTQATASSGASQTSNVANTGTNDPVSGSQSESSGMSSGDGQSKTGGSSGNQSKATESSSKAGAEKAAASTAGKSVATSITTKISMKVIVAIIAVCVIAGGTIATFVRRSSTTTTSTTTTAETTTATEEKEQTATEIAESLGFNMVQTKEYETSYRYSDYNSIRISEVTFDGGYLAAKLTDLDQDNIEELLLVETNGVDYLGTQYDSNSITFYISVYEKTNESWELTDKESITTSYFSGGNARLDLFTNNKGQIFIESYYPVGLFYEALWGLQEMYYSDGNLELYDSSYGDDAYFQALVVYCDGVDTSYITWDESSEPSDYSDEEEYTYDDFMNELKSYGFNISFVGYKSIMEQDNSLIKLTEINLKPEESDEELYELSANTSDSFGHVNVTITTYE